MATEVEARIVLVNLKEWLKRNNSADRFSQLLTEFNKLNALEEPSLSLLYGLGVTENNLNVIMNFPNYYRHFCKEILSYCHKEFILASQTKIPWKQFYQCIISKSIDASLINLLDVLTELRHSRAMIKACDCIQYFLHHGFITELLWKQCLVKPVSAFNNKLLYSPKVNMFWDQLMKVLISLPERMANTFQLKTSSIFEPTTYFNLLSRSIEEVLLRIHTFLEGSKDCSLTFVSQLFAKVCVTGKAAILYDVLVPSISTWVEKSPLWRRICSKFFLSVPDLSLESAIEPLLKRTISSDLLFQLFGDAVLSKPKLKFLMTHKFIFMRTYTNDVVPFNVVKYISASTSTESCFKEVLFKLLSVWGDRTSIKHTALQQHLYISRCLLIALGCMREHQKKAWKSDLILKLMEGVPAHLESPDSKLHEIGMVVAECLTSVVDNNGKQLKFDLVRNTEIDYLFELSHDPLAAIRLKQQETISSIKDVGKMLLEECEVDVQDKSAIDEELDSDDDLEPINVDEDEDENNVNGVKPPVYLRDCIAGLLSSNDPNRLEACLKVLERLVMKQPGNLTDVSVELVKILLHLENEYNITDFYTLKSRAMITIAVKCPTQISKYIAQEFYEENYTLNQRVDMLEVVSNAATRLAKPSSEDPEMFREHLPQLQNLPGCPLLSANKVEWQIVIDDRVKNKTRRFKKGPTREPDIPKENRFTDVAGLFFFPLLKQFGKKVNTCDMLGADCFILAKFIYTLATVLKAADGLGITQVMGRSLFNFIWSLRYHKEAFVRQSLMYALSTIAQHVPSFALMTELQSELFEARDWLQELRENDPNMECRKLAVSCLILMEQTIRQELTGAA